jgi:hypothetical protein
MKKITFLLLLAVASVSAQTPSWTWARNQSLSSNDSKRMTAVDPSGNVYLASTFTAPTLTVGTTTLVNNSTFWSFWDFFIVKYDRAGSIIWVKSFGGPNADSVVSLDTDADGNLYVGGGFQGSVTFDDITLMTVNPQGFVMKMNPNGDVLWAKTGDADNLVYVSDMCVGRDGNVYISGSAVGPHVKFNGVVMWENEFYDADNPRARPYAAKFDSDGNIIWVRGGQSNHLNPNASHAESVAADGNGNVFLSGRFGCDEITFGDVTLVKTTNYTHTSNMFVVKYNSEGEVQWGKSAGTIYENNTHGTAAATDQDGNSFVAGFFSNSVSWDDQTIYSLGGSSGYLVKFSPNGTALWARASNAINGAAWNRSLSLDPQGSIYVGGMMFGSQIYFDQVLLTTTGEGMGYVVKYGTDGTAIWARKIDPLNMNNEISVSVLTENEIYVGGTFFNNTLNFSPHSVTRDPLTNYNVFLGRLYYEPLAVDGHDTTQMVLYPNPTNGQLHFSNLTQPTDFQLFDASGREVSHGTLAGGTLDVSHLSQGVYFIQLGGAEFSQSLKFVKI